MADDKRDAKKVYDTSLFKLGPVVKEYDVDYMPPDIEFAPQAILRDLHRPEKKFEISPFEIPRHELLLDGGRGAWAGLRSDQQRKLRVDLQALWQTHREFVSVGKELRSNLKFDWSTAPKIETKRSRW